MSVIQHFYSVIYLRQYMLHCTAWGSLCITSSIRVNLNGYLSSGMSHKLNESENKPV